jgi:glyoxylate reductase
MPAKPRVFVSRRIPAVGLDLIAPHCDADVWPDPLPPPDVVLHDRVRECDGLISLLTDRVDAALLDAAPKLKVVSNFAVGFNNVDLAAATKRGVRVGNTPGVLTEATADIAITLLMAAARRLGESTQDARDGRWKTWDPLGWLGRDMAGRTLGIVGMGRIGHSVARKLHHGWGMKVLYSDQVGRPDVETELQATRVELGALLRESDFVSVHTDLNPHTKGMFGRAQFARMKPTAVFINTARGPIVQQEALAEALRSKTIFAAGLDVTDPEPLPPDHELLHLPNCIVTPHIASATVHTRNEMARICAENLIAGLAGRPLPACVNPEVERR